MIVILVIFVVQAPAGGWFWLSSPCFWMFLILMLISLEHPQEGRRWCCSPKRLPGHVGQKTLEAAFLCDIVYIEPSGNHLCHAQLRIHIDFANFQFQLFTWPQIIASSTTRHHIVPFLFFFCSARPPVDDFWFSSPCFWMFLMLLSSLHVRSNLSKHHVGVSCVKTLETNAKPHHGTNVDKV